MNLKSTMKRWIYGSAGAFPYFGCRVYFPRRSHVFEKACEEGIYEKESVRLVAALVRPGTYYFDVGANIGLLAIPILDYHPDCKVISFEPSPNTLPHLERTVRESRFKDRWSVIGKATGSVAGTAAFFKHAPALGAYDSLRQTGRAGAVTSSSVPVTTLDAEWEALGRPPVSMIKMDVEGAELATLKGAAECIRHCQPSLFLEWSPENLAAFDCEPAALFETAGSLGYAIFSLLRMTPIESAAGLQLQMLKDAGFVLVPRVLPAHWKVDFQPFRGLQT